METKDQEYHLRRARQELDLGYRADGRMAAAAHMRLAALHMASAQPGADQSGPEDDRGGTRSLQAMMDNARDG